MIFFILNGLWLWTLVQPGLCSLAAAADEKPGRTQGKMDATVIHVDKLGIYVPEMVLYWDETVGKQKLATLTSAAERLRNKRATITYSVQGNPAQDKRPLVVDIVPSQEHSPETAPVTSPPEPPEVVHYFNESSGSLNRWGLIDITRPYPERDVGSARPGDKGSPTEGGTDGSTPPSQEADSPPLPSAKSLPIVKRDALMLVEHMLHLTTRKSLDSILYYYGDTVNYYARGDVGKDYVRRDLGYYFKNWDTIRCGLEGDIQLVDTPRPDVKVVKFRSSYSVQNDKKTVSGMTDNTWKIQRTQTGLKVIDQKQTIIDGSLTDKP